MLVHHPAGFALDQAVLGPWETQITRSYGTSGITLLTTSCRAVGQQADEEASP
jgi:hypothetical protein